MKVRDGQKQKGTRDSLRRGRACVEQDAQHCIAAGESSGARIPILPCLAILRAPPILPGQASSFDHQGAF